MFILDITAPDGRAQRPALVAEPAALPLNNGQNRNGNNQAPRFDSAGGTVNHVPGLGIEPADTRLSPIFRRVLQLFEGHPRQEEISALLFGSNERRVAFIVNNLPELACCLSEDEDDEAQQEIQAVAMVGIVDPNPNGPLRTLLGMVGSLNNPEAMALALAKISDLNQLAQFVAQQEARRGNAGQAREYAAAVNGAGSLSIPAASTIGGDFSISGLTFVSLAPNNQVAVVLTGTNSVVNETIGTANRVVARRERDAQLQARRNQVLDGIGATSDPTRIARLRHELGEIGRA